MIFRVKRTSHYGTPDGPPVPRATITDTEDKWDDRHWVVELATLDELIELLKSEGHDLILRDDYEPDGTSIMGIEVYDDYRE